MGTKRTTSKRTTSKRTTSKRTTSKKRALVRGEPVVRGILGATLEELASAGYGALRIEDVAARAAVNKTTIYRRWPTKPDLVRDALRSVTIDRIVAPNTGSLRGDLLAAARDMAAHASSAEGQGLRRVMIAEERDEELMAITRSIHESIEAIPRSVIEAALARGEIARGTDGLLLFKILVSTIHHRLFIDRHDLDDAFLHRLVDLVLLGALPRLDRTGSRETA